MSEQRLVLSGRGRLLPSGPAGPSSVTFGEADFELLVGGETRVAAYRDLETIAIQQATVLLVLGSGTAAERFLLDQFGQELGQLVRELRDRRLRQRLTDALVSVPDETIDLVEFEFGGQHGVAQLVYDPWGAVVAPLDEREAWIRVRRAAIGDVRADPTKGLVTVAAGAGGGTPGGFLRLPGLGARAQLHAGRFAALRDAAWGDAGRLVGGLIPDAGYAVRQQAARALVDGRPARPADLPDAWPAIEAGVLVDPTFAASYQALVAKAGDLADARSIALSPVDPGGDKVRSWFFVPLPGNLVALELVSEGAHATYCFRAQPRARYGGGPTDRAAITDALRDVSEALVDSRFLREPMALAGEALRQPRYLRYRLALVALPSLAAARARFVARIVHRDAETWASALADLIAWHTTARDDALAWPGRSAQDSIIDDAAEVEPGPPAGAATPDLAGLADRIVRQLMPKSPGGA